MEPDLIQIFQKIKKKILVFKFFIVILGACTGAVAASDPA
jgi:hypothetical protein